MRELCRFICLLPADGYENLALKRQTVSETNTPYAQLDFPYEELPDRKMDTEATSPAVDDYEHLDSKRKSTTDVVTSPYQRLEAHGTIPEPSSDAQDPQYDNIHRAMP